MRAGAVWPFWGREGAALRGLAAISGLIVGLAGSQAAAEEREEEPLLAPVVEVVGEPEEEPVGEDPTAPTDVVVLDDRAASSTLADVLDELPGVRVSRLGGLEAFATVSIRGSTSSQVLVLRDGVPLGSASSAEVNLAEIGLVDVERVEVYRGPAAAHFGSGGLGGVVNLVSREPEGGGAAGRLELGLGSFMPGSWDPLRIFGFTAERSVAGTVAGGIGPLRLRASGRYVGTVGDFTFLDDNGTTWDEGDDRFARRENNDASQADLSVRGAAELAPGLRLLASESLSARDAGVAGTGAILATVARLRDATSLTLLELERTSAASPVPFLRAAVSGRVRRDEWSDLLGEIGTGREHDADLTVDVGGRLRLGWVLRDASAWVQAEVRGEQFLAESRFGAAPGWGWRRATGALGGWVSWQLAGDLVELSPQARLELVGDGPTGEGPPLIAGAEEPEATTRLFSSAQLGALVRPLGWLSLRASAALSQRPPSFLELLGDRGAIAGNPLLRPETGWTLDAGARLEGRDLGPLARGRLEVTGFYRLVDDLIQLVPNSQATFVAANVGGASIAGLEAAGLLRVDWGTAARSPWPAFVTLRAGVTFMDAVDRSGRAFLEGKQLPLRPRWETFLRAAASFGPFELAYELDALSGNYLDPYNAWPVPQRVIHSAELSADLTAWGGPVLALVARNLADQITETLPVLGLGDRTRPVTDVAGFPLPGLTLFLSARWDLPRARES